MMSQLLFWAGLSLGVGVPMLFSSREWVRSFGGMTAAWAIVNAIIAILSLLSVRRKARQNADAETIRGWMHHLVRLLWLNAGLDVVYVLVGVGLIVWNPTNRMLNGFGWAVIIQGAFLLLFDTWHAVRLPRRVRLQQE
jgi:integral membrane sensor domain MASE1